jgi:hypothetical protein
MDRPIDSAAAQSEIQFLLSLLRISYPGEPAPRASDMIERLLASKSVN